MRRFSLAERLLRISVPVYLARRTLSWRAVALAFASGLVYAFAMLHADGGIGFGLGFREVALGVPLVAGAVSVAVDSLAAWSHRRRYGA